MTAMGTTGANPLGWPRARDDCAIAGATGVTVAAVVAVALASARAARLASGVIVVPIAAAGVVCAALVSAA
jgi:hypothetical protein